MSFSFEFVAKQADAIEIVEKEVFAPDCVKAFVQQGLKAFTPDKLVSVKANGHLYKQDFPVSTGNISVQEVVVREPVPQKST